MAKRTLELRKLGKAKNPIEQEALTYQDADEDEAMNSDSSEEEQIE